MPINLDKIGQEFTLDPFEHNPQTVELYHLGIGITDLEYVYEKNLKVMPTFAVVPAFGILVASIGVAGANPMMTVHGEQRIEIAKRPIPWSGTTVTTGKIANVYDKGKGALLVIEADTVDENGELLFRNIYSLFARGEGGFGGERGPSSKKNVPPERDPDHVVEIETSPTQQLIYRLSGDLNPLHADPEFAKMVGYDRPILHGLCSYGIVCRSIVEASCGGDPTKMKDFEVRFSGEVYPGDTICTEIWEEADNKVIVSAKTKDGRVVITNGAATLS